MQNMIQIHRVVQDLREYLLIELMLNNVSFNKKVVVHMQVVIDTVDTEADPGFLEKVVHMYDGWGIRFAYLLLFVSH